MAQNLTPYSQSRLLRLLSEANPNVTLPGVGTFGEALERGYFDQPALAKLLSLVRPQGMAPQASEGMTGTATGSGGLGGLY